MKTAGRICSILTAFYLLTTSTAFAVSEPPADPPAALIDQMIVGSVGDIYVYFGTDFLEGTTHDVCTRTDRYILHRAHVAYNALYAALLTAHTSGHKVAVYIDGGDHCAGKDSPKVHALRIK